MWSCSHSKTPNSPFQAVVLHQLYETQQNLENLNIRSDSEELEHRRTQLLIESAREGRQRLAAELRQQQLLEKWQAKERQDRERVKRLQARSRLKEQPRSPESRQGTEDMATRRSARATSRPVSSIASSANPDALSSPRVTTRRAGNAQLPAVNVRSSTAYGTNTVPALMTRAPQPQTQQLNDYLGNILDPVREEESTSEF